MAHIKKALVVLALLSAGAAFAQTGAQAIKCWQLLGKAMENQRKVTCKGLILCPDPMNPDSLLSVWSEQVGGGQLKMTVLNPLSSQGITSLDNGHDWITYTPDQNRLMIEASPREEETERTERNRIRLAETNYILSLVPDVEVAGRRCHELKAVAKHPEMPVRLYAIDKQKDYLLRMLSVSPGDRRILLDTKSIDFPHSIPDEDFELEPHSDAHMVTYAAPVTITINKETKQVVGFRPAVPSSLPFGFVVEAPQVVESRNGKFLAVRITDGLANATVYEWSDHKNQPRARVASQSDYKSANGIRIRVKSDLPRQVEGGLLDCFIKEALKRVESCLIPKRDVETLDLKPALNCPEETNREDAAHRSSAEDLSEIYAIVLIDVEE